MLSLLWYTINCKWGYLEIETHIGTTHQNMSILGKMVLLDFHYAKIWCVLNKISANLKGCNFFFLVEAVCLPPSIILDLATKSYLSFSFFFWIIPQNVGSVSEAWSSGSNQTTLLPAVYTLHEAGNAALPWEYPPAH